MNLYTIWIKDSDGNSEHIIISPSQPKNNRTYTLKPNTDWYVNKQTN